MEKGVSALDFQNSHMYCKRLLSDLRKQYKCPQKMISGLKDSAEYWHIYIDPEGYVGAYKECCKWSAMAKAVEEKFKEAL